MIQKGLWNQWVDSQGSILAVLNLCVIRGQSCSSEISLLVEMSSVVVMSGYTKNLFSILITLFEQLLKVVINSYKSSNLFKGDAGTLIPENISKFNA